MNIQLYGLPIKDIDIIEKLNKEENIVLVMPDVFDG